jgi:hypothetical protein
MRKLYPSKSMLLRGVSYTAMMATWAQRYAAMLIADQIRKRGKP